jgi:hypothetical protein
MNAPEHALERTQEWVLLLLGMVKEDVTVKSQVVIQEVRIVMIGTILTILGFRAQAYRQMIVRLDPIAIQLLAE